MKIQNPYYTSRVNHKEALPCGNKKTVVVADNIFHPKYGNVAVLNKIKAACIWVKPIRKEVICPYSLGGKIVVVG